MPDHPPVAGDEPPSPFPWPPVLLVLVVAAALALDTFLLRLPIPLAETATVHAVGVLTLMAAGSLLAWAASRFRRHDTSIRPDRGSRAFITDGPYTFSRNPIYLGDLLALIGAALVFNRLWLLAGAALFAIAVTRLAICREEAYLERRFGRPYLDYRSRVRRWL